MIRRNWYYTAAVLFVLIGLVYTIGLHRGFKEDHMGHLNMIAVFFPFIANVASKNKFIYDLGFNFIVIVAVVIAGKFYWLSQDKRYDFSFENWYEWEAMLLLFFSSFVISQLTKLTIFKIQNR